MNTDFRRDAAPRPPLTTALNEMEWAQLIRRLEESDGASGLSVYLFKHALVQESVYTALLRQDRKRLHRLVGEALERAYPERLEELAPRLAAHFDEAGDLTRALYYYERAAKEAADRFANREALGFYTHALNIAEELQTDTRDSLFRARGLVHERIGEFSDACADLELALGFARGTDDGVAEWESLLDLGFAWTARDYAKAGEYFVQALELARATNDAARIAQSLNRVGNWHMNKEDPQRALAYHHEALGIFEGLNDTRGVADTHDLLGISGMMGSDFYEGVAHFRRAVELYRSLNDRRGEAASLISLNLQNPSMHSDVLVLGEAGDMPEEGLTQLVQLTQELGWRAGEAFVLWTSGERFASIGNYARALDLEQQAMALSQEIDHRQWLAASTMFYGAICADVFNFELAIPALERGFSLGQEVGSQYWTHNAAGTLASVFIAQNEITRAQVLLDEFAPLTLPAVTLGQRQMWMARIELALAQHAPDRAVAMLDQMLKQTPNLKPNIVIPRLSLFQALALLQLDLPQRAEPVAQAVYAALLERPQTRLLWRTHGVLSRVYRAQGRAEKAKEATQAAQAIVATLAATLNDVAMRENFIRRADEWIQGN